MRISSSEKSAIVTAIQKYPLQYDPKIFLTDLSIASEKEIDSHPVLSAMKEKGILLN